MNCSKCSVEITEKVGEYSKKKFGKELCFTCQKDSGEKVSTPKKGCSSSGSKIEGVDDKNIISLQGKEFITFAGLLQKAHASGLQEIRTTMLTEPTAETIVFKSEVIMLQKGVTKTYTGYGDANKDNVGRMILPHKLRMSETRANARALRLATNIGMCSVEELGGNDKNE